MANKFIKSLPVASPLTSGCQLYGVDPHGQTRPITLDKIARFVYTSPGRNSSNLRPRGCLVYRTTDYSFPQSDECLLPFEVASYDYDSIWNLNDPCRLWVPDGATVVRVRMSVAYSYYNNGYRKCRITHNTGGLTSTDRAVGLISLAPDSTGAYHSARCSTGPIPVSNGDYFQCYAFGLMNATQTIKAVPYTWASMEILEAQT